MEAKDLAVIICTHNPRRDFLRRTLDGLRRQTLRGDCWELLLIDNASRQPLVAARAKKRAEARHQGPEFGEVDLSWHPNARIVREDRLGLTPARLRGVEEAKGEILVFVDDDNVLAPDYLETALALCAKHQFLGAIGGRIDPEYENECPDWFKPYQIVLAIRQPEKARWSNAWDDWKSQPWGAGMVVRREVCQAYAKLLGADPRRMGMDRAGGSLFSGGDVDLVLTCLDLGFGYGVFPELALKHLIPPSRVNPEYVLKITRGLSASNLWLKHLRGHPWQLAERRSWYTHLRGYYHFLKRDRMAKRIEEATFAGQSDFLAKLDDERKGPRVQHRPD